MLQPAAPAEEAWRRWCVPLSEEEMTLQEALDSLARVGARPEEVPLIVRLLENPGYRVPGTTLFHGAVDLFQHDAIHAVLGRGLLGRDEAFVIGFTMGSTRQVGGLERRLFCWIASHLYPWVYRFRPQDAWVFHGAVQLASASGCRRLDRVDFRAHLQQPLGSLRRWLGISSGVLQRFYRLEVARYPGTPESRRLLA